MRSAPAAQVVAWLDAQASEQVWVCAVTRAEIELGVSLLPDGQRKLGLQMAAIAVMHGLTLATRNESDFELIERLAVVNPWSSLS